MSENHLPRAHEAEKSLIGACFLRDEVAPRLALLGLDARDFYDPRHKALWAAISALLDEGRPIDASTMEAKLTAHEKLEAVGGLAYLSELAIRTPTADNADHYLGLVRDTKLAREVLLALSEIPQDIRRQDLSGAEALQLAQERLGGMRGGTGRREPLRLSQAARAATERMVSDMQERERGEAPPARIPTGLYALDVDIGGGLGRGTWTLIAARPKIGKTATIMQLCRNAPVPAAVFLTEEVDDIVYRELAVSSGVGAADIAGQRFSDSKDLRAVLQAATSQREDLFLVDARGMSALNIAREARALARQHGIQLLAVDYLNRLRHPRADRYDLSIRATLDTLDDLIGELGIAGILGAQLGRGVEKENRLPRIDDARDCGAIEEICKLGICLHRPYLNGGKDSDGNQRQDDEMWLILDLQNLGARRQVKRFEWDGPRMTIRDRDLSEPDSRLPQEQQEVPF